MPGMSQVRWVGGEIVLLTAAIMVFNKMERKFSASSYIVTPSNVFILILRENDTMNDTNNHSLTLHHMSLTK